MTDLTLFVGLDVHKKAISVALVEAWRAPRCGSTARSRMRRMPCAVSVQEAVEGRTAAVLLL